jgi:hypothetical protein
VSHSSRASEEFLIDFLCENSGKNEEKSMKGKLLTLTEVKARTKGKRNPLNRKFKSSAM